uniref:Oxidase (Cytochrome c) assembly 1-like protein n=1 Tax=Callorhinchus milii TaxID=7868 RepID=V9KZ66_CALMI
MQAAACVSGCRMLCYRCVWRHRSLSSTLVHVRNRVTDTATQTLPSLASTATGPQTHALPSLAAMAGRERATEGGERATEGVEGGLEGGEASLSIAGGETSLSELGLGGNSPVGLVQNILEHLHTDLTLPWWGAIITGTVLARLLVFPVIVKGQREAAKLNNHMPEMTRLTNLMNEAKHSGNKFDFAKTYSDLMLFQKKHDINPFRGFLVPLVQAPVFLSFFMALRQMASLPVPGLQTGGIGWFIDLTAPDPLFILPLAVTASMWVILELGAESGVDNPNLRTMKTVFRIMPLAILPFTINFPTAVFTYWMTSNVFSLIQVGFLRIPAVRHRLKIPDRIQHSPEKLPQNQGFIKSLQSGWKNAQSAHQLQERERRIKNHLQLAAKGPLRQTFAENPVQKKESHREKQKARPWEDTIG